MIALYQCGSTDYEASYKAILEAKGNLERAKTILGLNIPPPIILPP